jgi:hypothetical protein
MLPQVLAFEGKKQSIGKTEGKTLALKSPCEQILVDLIIYNVALEFRALNFWC